MKSNRSLTRTPALLTTLSLLPTLVQAHPGHSAFDWFSGAPHAGHESEYAVVVIILALVVFGFGAWLVSRKR